MQNAEVVVTDVRHRDSRRVVRLGTVSTSGSSLAWAGDGRLISTVRRRGRARMYLSPPPAAPPVDLTQSDSDALLPSIRPAGPQPAA